MLGPTKADDVDDDDDGDENADEKHHDVGAAAAVGRIDNVVSSRKGTVMTRGLLRWRRMKLIGGCDFVVLLETLIGEKKGGAILNVH